MTSVICTEAVMSEAGSYATSLERDLYLPRQGDKGCVTAVGAFTLNRLVDIDTATAADMDEAIDRKEGEFGNVLHLVKWYLRKGFSVERISPSSSLDEPFQALASGDMGFDEYWVHYQAQYGEFDPIKIPSYEKYYRDVVLPAHVEKESLLLEYAETRQHTLRSAEVTPEVLEGCVNNGAVVVADAASKNNGTTHKIAVIRPSEEQPALVYWPKQRLESKLYVLTPTLFASIVSLQAELLVVSR